MKSICLFICILSFLTIGYSQIKDAEYYTKLGLSYCSDGNYNEGMICYAKAIEIDPNYFDAYVDRGIWRMALRDYDGAINDFKIAFTLDTLSLLAIHNLGGVYQLSGELDSALSCYNKSISLDSLKSGSYQNRGDIFFAFGNLDLAIADYTKEIQLGQKGFLAFNYYMRGIARLEKGDSISGNIDLKKALETESLNEHEMRMHVNYLRGYRDK